MQNIDILMSLFIIVLSIKGLFKGATKEVIGLLVLFLSIVIAPIFAEHTGAFVSDKLHLNTSKEAFYFLGYISLVILFMISGGIINFITNLFYKVTGLGILDRITGIFVGALKAVLIITIIITVGSKLDFTSKYFQEKGKNSQYYERLLNLGNKLMYNVDNIKKKAKENSSKIEEKASNITNSILDNKHIKNVTDTLSNEKTRTELINSVQSGITDGIKTLEKQIPEEKK